MYGQSPLQSMCNVPHSWRIITAHENPGRFRFLVNNLYSPITYLAPVISNDWRLSRKVSSRAYLPWWQGIDIFLMMLPVNEENMENSSVSSLAYNTQDTCDNVWHIITKSLGVISPSYRCVSFCFRKRIRCLIDHVMCWDLRRQNMWCVYVTVKSHLARIHTTHRKPLVLSR